MLKVYIADCTFLKDHKEWEQKEKLISDFRRKRMDSFRSPEDRRRSLTAALLLRTALGEEHISYENASFTLGPHGKPELLEGGLFFNLSHGGDWALCAVSDQRVGADVEKLSRLVEKKNRAEHIARKCLSEEERAFLEKSDCFEEELIRLWTKKESYAKMTGEGLSRDFTTINTLKYGCYEQRILRGGYCATVCTDNFCGPALWQEAVWNKNEQEAVLQCMMN